MRSLRVLIVAVAIFAAGLVTSRGHRHELATATPATDAPASTSSLDPKPAPADIPVIRTSLAAFSTVAKDQAAAHATTLAPRFVSILVVADAVLPAVPRTPSPLIVPLRI